MNVTTLVGLGADSSLEPAALARALESMRQMRPSMWPGVPALAAVSIPGAIATGEKPLIPVRLPSVAGA